MAFSNFLLSLSSAWLLSALSACLAPYASWLYIGGRIKRSISDTRQEIEQQIGADDIRRQLHNEEVMERLARAEAQMNKSLSVDDAKQLVDQSSTEDEAPNNGSNEQPENNKQTP